MWVKCESGIVLSPVLFNNLFLCLICKYIICNIILVTKKLALNKMLSKWMCIYWWLLPGRGKRSRAGQPLVVITVYNYFLHNHLMRPRKKYVNECNINNSGNVHVAIMSRTNVNTNSNVSSFIITQRKSVYHLVWYGYLFHWPRVLRHGIAGSNPDGMDVSRVAASGWSRVQVSRAECLVCASVIVKPRQ